MFPRHLLHPVRSWHQPPIPSDVLPLPGGYQQVPACVRVTGIVSLNRALELIDQVVTNFEVPVNKKYVPNYSYSREMAENYLASLKEKEENKEEVVNA